MMVLWHEQNKPCTNHKQSTTQVQKKCNVYTFCFSFFWKKIQVPAIQSEIKLVDPYITALSIVGGLGAFGISGVLVGPLMVCVLAVVRNITVALFAVADTSRLDA